MIESTELNRPKKLPTTMASAPAPLDNDVGVQWLSNHFHVRGDRGPSPRSLPRRSHALAQSAFTPFSGR
ncbi:MAG: hypothetical protein AAF550_14595, partial [Myxococcota bacterium]